MTDTELEILLESDAADLLSGADLQLQVATGRGRADEVEELMLLSQSDIDMLRQSGPAHSTPQIRHIRHYHHRAAMMLAAGDRAGQVAAALGLTAATLSRLQKDPQFQDLVEEYRDKVERKILDQVELAGMVSYEALAAIHERLIDEEVRDAIPLEALRKLMVDTLDRTGHSPVRRSETNHTERRVLSIETISRIKDLHPRAAAHEEADPQRALEAGHEEASLRAGAAGSISAVLVPASAEPIDVTPEEGSGV